MTPWPMRLASVSAYTVALVQFRSWIRLRHGDLPPQSVSARIMLDYVLRLRQARHNGDFAVNRTVTVLKNFYRAMVAMGHLEHVANPLAPFPTMKAAARKLPTVLSGPEVRALLDAPPSDTVLGLRDRAILALLYGNGIRASDCTTVREDNVDLSDQSNGVTGKGGHQRVLQLPGRLVEVLPKYRTARGPVPPSHPFFRSRTKRGLSRGAV